MAPGFVLLRALLVTLQVMLGSVANATGQDCSRGTFIPDYSCRTQLHSRQCWGVVGDAEGVVGDAGGVVSDVRAVTGGNAGIVAGAAPLLCLRLRQEASAKLNSQCSRRDAAAMQFSCSAARQSTFSNRCIASWLDVLAWRALILVAESLVTWLLLLIA